MRCKCLPFNCRSWPDVLDGPQTKHTSCPTRPGIEIDELMLLTLAGRLENKRSGTSFAMLELG